MTNDKENIKGIMKMEQLFEIYNCSNNYRHGVYKSYYRNGKIYQIMNYNNGTIEGLHQIYNNEGVVTETYYYFNGEKIN